MRLVVIEVPGLPPGATQAQEFQLQPDPQHPVWSVGRQLGSNIHLVDASVSRSHAELQPHPEGVLVRDLSSANGTFINDRRLPPNVPMLLRPGDRLRVGNVVTILEAWAMPPSPATSFPAPGRMTEPLSDAQRAGQDKGRPAPASSPRGQLPPNAGPAEQPARYGGPIYGPTVGPQAQPQPAPVQFGPQPRPDLARPNPPLRRDEPSLPSIQNPDFDLPTHQPPRYPGPSFVTPAPYDPPTDPAGPGQYGSRPLYEPQAQGGPPLQQYQPQSGPPLQQYLPPTGPASAQRQPPYRLAPDAPRYPAEPRNPQAGPRSRPAPTRQRGFPWLPFLLGLLVLVLVGGGILVYILLNPTKNSVAPALATVDLPSGVSSSPAQADTALGVNLSRPAAWTRSESGPNQVLFYQPNKTSLVLNIEKPPSPTLRDAALSPETAIRQYVANVKGNSSQNKVVQEPASTRLKDGTAAVLTRLIFTTQASPIVVDYTLLAISFKCGNSLYFVSVAAEGSDYTPAIRQDLDAAVGNLTCGK